MPFVNSDEQLADIFSKGVSNKVFNYIVFNIRHFLLNLEGVCQNEIVKGGCYLVRIFLFQILLVVSQSAWNSYVPASLMV